MFVTGTALDLWTYNLQNCKLRVKVLIICSEQQNDHKINHTVSRRANENLGLLKELFTKFKLNSVSMYLIRME